MSKKKLKDFQKKTIELFRVACDGLATSVNQQLFDGGRKWYWIGDEVGGVCDFEECDVLNPEDMVRIIDNNRYINLKSWLMGLRHDMIEKEK